MPRTSCKEQLLGAGWLVFSGQAHKRKDDEVAAPFAVAGRSLRVALVASSYNYIKDGVALTLNRLVAYLEKQGVEVLVFAPVADAPAFDHSGTVVAVPSMPLPARPEYRLAFGLWRHATERLEAFKPDILHLAVSPDFLGYSALRWAQRRNVPIVASCHTRYETYLRHYWYAAAFAGPLRQYLRFVYGACREVYVPSQSMVDVLVADGFVDNFRLWPRGVDTARFTPAKRSTAWRSTWGIGDDELVVLFASRLVREKQLDTLVAALRLAGAMPHRVLIVGDGPERVRMEASLPGAIFTGFLDGEDLARAYASSDMFVFPSETETFGSVTLEAMASGLPCVCADATGSRSLVVHGRTGYLAEPGNEQAFADDISILLRDPVLRRRMGTAARERSLEFSWDEAMARIHGYYRSVLTEAAA